MRIVKIIVTIALFCMLTILTQVGGLLYLLSLRLYPYINKSTSNIYLQSGLKFVSFLAIYCLGTFLLVPAIAPSLGRVPLPITQTGHLQPLNTLTCMLNRNYVRPEMKAAAFAIAQQMDAIYAGTTINYLDANFPFINKFPLLPHLSHNDGKKLDLSFCYLNSTTGEPTSKCPSFIGYGVCEEALPGEKNTADFCAENGYWQYSFLRKFIPQRNKKEFTFDSSRTRTLVNLCAEQTYISKIFIEPHLKSRLKLDSDKIRFHGCQAVRHDDHIHIQLK